MATVRELLKALRDMPGDEEVKVWLPGSTISLEPTAFQHKGKPVYIEGNVDVGSALMRFFEGA